jgi:hypothetical protein
VCAHLDQEVEKIGANLLELGLKTLLLPSILAIIWIEISLEKLLKMFPKSKRFQDAGMEFRIIFYQTEFDCTDG